MGILCGTLGVLGAIVVFVQKIMEKELSAKKLESCTSLGFEPILYKIQLCRELVIFLVFVQKILHPNIAVGYASLMVVMLMLFSILMFLIGIMGEYIGSK